MKKFIILLVMCLSAQVFSQAGTQKLIEVINAQGPKMNKVSLLGPPFPQIMKDPQVLKFKNGVLTYIQKPTVKGEQEKFVKCYTGIPIAIIVKEEGLGEAITKTMRVIVNEEGSQPPKGHQASCTKAVEKAIPKLIKDVTGLVKLNVGPAKFVSTKDTIKYTFVDGLMTASGSNAAGDEKTTVYLPNYFLTTVISDKDAKGIIDVTIRGDLNLIESESKNPLKKKK